MSDFLYRAARLSRDAKAVQRAIEQRSLEPILKRLLNKLIGRHIVSRLWWR